MRQQLSTLLVVVTLMILMFETFMIYLNVIDGIPLLRMICFTVLALYIIHTGELNRREYEAKRKKIKKLKAEVERTALINEYEQFRKEMHG